MSKEKTGDQLHQLVQALESLRGKENAVWLAAGEVFHTIKVLELWRPGGYHSFKSFCSEHQYAPSTAYNRISVHEAFIESELVKVEDLYHIDTTKLTKIAPHVDEDNVHEFLAQSDLSMTDLSKWMIEKGYDTPKPASHEACVLIAWLVGGNWRGPAVDFYDDPGVARDDFAETVEMVARMDVIGTLEADIYHTGKKKLNYSYRDGHWSGGASLGNMSKWRAT